MTKSTFYWLLDRLSENSTWRGIVGVLAAIGAFSNLKDPEVAAKFIATGMGLIALINMLRTAPPTGKEVAQAIKTGDTSTIAKPIEPTPPTAPTP